MTVDDLGYRECADCYYRQGRRCLGGGRRPAGRDEACASFVRASIRLAFFHAFVERAS